MQETDKIRREYSDIIWNKNGKYTHNELDLILKDFQEEVRKKTLKEVREKIKKYLLENLSGLIILIQIYARNR
jgi:predicted house-cleaning noncanonical NTP pyrophosphatase (MazG superfamily)